MMKNHLNEQELQELLDKTKTVEQKLLDQCEKAKQLYLKYEQKIIHRDLELPEISRDALQEPPTLN